MSGQHLVLAVLEKTDPGIDGAVEPSSANSTCPGYPELTALLMVWRNWCSPCLLVSIQGIVMASPSEELRSLSAHFLLYHLSARRGKEWPSLTQARKESPASSSLFTQEHAEPDIETELGHLESKPREHFRANQTNSMLKLMLLLRTLVQTSLTKHCPVGPQLTAPSSMTAALNACEVQSL